MAVDTTHLLDELLRARWFGGKSRGLRSATFLDQARWTPDSSWTLLSVEYELGPPDLYALADAFDTPLVARQLLERFGGGSVATDAGGTLVFAPTHVLRTIDLARTEPIRALQGEQSNSSTLFGSALILKLFRRVQFGPQPDVEIGRFLTEYSRFQGTPQVAGTVEYHTADGEIASVALLQCFAPNRGDAWRTTLARLELVLSGLADVADSERAAFALGCTTAELHLALADAPPELHDFAAEPISPDDVSAWRSAIREEVLRATSALEQRQIHVDVEQMLQRADGIHGVLGSQKIRHHGDYHLGQVLESDDGGFVIIDFEGEPSKPLTLRREKRSPLRDVAGMLRSFDYARNAALRAHDLADPLRVERATEWHAASRDAFLSAYLGTIRAQAPTLLPAEVEAALSALELEKAAYEVLYELNNRPEWLPIPLAALTQPTP